MINLYMQGIVPPLIVSQ